MPSTQSQYQVRFVLGDSTDTEADLELWADAFGLAQVPDGIDAVVSLRNRSAVARWVVAEQERRGVRTSVLVRAVPSADPGGFPVAHLAVAGAVIEALSDAGIDHTSPEAATALAAWVGVRPAYRHLIRASAEARALIDRGLESAVSAGLELDVDEG